MSSAQRSNQVVLIQPRDIRAESTIVSGQQMNINKIVAECNPFELPSISLAQREELPSIVALYFVLYNNRVLYVGATVCLKNRWKTHELKNILSRDRLPSSQVRIAWLEHQDLELNLKRVEKCTIELFQPVYNKQKFFGTVEWLSQPSLWKTLGNNMDSPVDNLGRGSVDYSPLSLCCEGMDESAVIDRLPVKGFWDRYGIHRSLFYRRMKELGIKAHMVGTKGYLDAEQIKLLDDLHEFLSLGENRQTPEFLEKRKQSTQLSSEESTNQCLKQGNSLTECAIEDGSICGGSTKAQNFPRVCGGKLPPATPLVKAGSFFKSDEAQTYNGSKVTTEHDSLLSSEPDSSSSSFIQLVSEIAAALRPQSNPLQYLECCERAAAAHWLLSTREIKQLIGVKPSGQNFTRGSFKFVRSGKIGAQAAWKVEKISIIPEEKV